MIINYFIFKANNLYFIQQHYSLRNFQPTLIPPFYKSTRTENKYKNILILDINVAITQTVPTNMKNLLGKIHRYSCSKYLQKNWSRIKCLPIKNISCRSFNRCCNRWKPMTKVRHYQAVPDFLYFKFTLLFTNIFSEGFPIVKYPVNPTSFPDCKYITQINKENTVHASASLLESPIGENFI